METQEQKTPMRDVALRAIAVLGLIAVLLLGAWGIIQLAVAIPTLFSNLGGGVSSFTQSNQKETLTVSSAATITSGQTLQVSWNHTNKDGEYSYAVSYACQNGLSVKAPLPTGTYQTIACNTPFNFVNATGGMTIEPTATGKALPLTLTVSATKLSTGAVTAQGTATTNVAPIVVATAPAKTTTSSNTSTSYYAAPVPQALYGYGDLAVSIQSVVPAQSGLTAVTFTISNLGTNRVPAGWTFNANLPINGSYMFASQPQRALNPGDKIVYTLTFSGGSNNYNGGYNPYPYGYNTNGYGYTGQGSYTGAGSYTGQGTYNCNGYSVCYPSTPIQPSYNYGYSTGPVTITADPQNYILESNELNNTATAY